MVQLPSTLRTQLILAALIRIAIACWGEWQDANMPSKYTDIDYVVFTDGAREVLAGHSPMDRATYRYTPLLYVLLGIPMITLAMCIVQLHHLLPLTRSPALPLSLTHQSMDHDPQCICMDQLG